MPSVDDVYNQLVTANTNLQTLHNDVQTVNSTLLTGFGDLVTIGNYTNQALAHISQQDDTIICILEKISNNTCAILNEAHAQTELQTTIAAGVSSLVDMYETVNPGAALERERLAKLQAEIEACCPPPQEPPPCSYTPCPEVGRLEPPPKVTPPKGQKSRG